MRYCRHCRREKSNLIWTPLSLTGLIRANRSGSGLQNWSGSTHCSSGSSLNKSSDKDSWTIFSHDFTAYKRTHIILHVMPSDASWLVLRSLWTYYASVTPFPGCLNFFSFFFFFVQMSWQYHGIAQRNPPSLLLLRHLDVVSRLLQVWPAAAGSPSFLEKV